MKNLYILEYVVKNGVYCSGLDVTETHISDMANITECAAACNK